MSETNEIEINKFIHEVVMGITTSPHGDETCICRRCQPDYCTDLNLAALAEAKAIEEKGFIYATHLRQILLRDVSRQVDDLDFATATALQRATAIREMYLGDGK